MQQDVCYRPRTGSLGVSNRPGKRPIRIPMSFLPLGKPRLRSSKKCFLVRLAHYRNAKQKRAANKECDLNHLFAAIGSKYLPLELQNPSYLISQNCPQRGIGSIRLAKVLIGRNSLPKVQALLWTFASRLMKKTSTLGSLAANYAICGLPT